MRFPWHWIIEKRGKYLKGASYATGIGYRFRWTHEKASAQRFDDEATAHNCAHSTGGRVIQIETAAE